MTYPTPSPKTTVLRAVRVQIDGWKCPTCGHATMRVHGTRGGYTLHCDGCNSLAMSLADCSADFLARIACQRGATATLTRLRPSQA
jgi:hypothetical protein